MKHINNYPIIQYKLKDDFRFEYLSLLGYKVYKHDASKEIVRNKRNEKIFIHCNSDKEFLISYYHKDEFVGYVLYRQRKYLRDLIVIGAIELIK